MKHRYTLLTALLLFGLGVNQSQAQRYLSEVFTQVNKTADVTYATNQSILTGSPTATPLMMDIYEPAGDTETERPLVIYLHTGSFLPILINNTPTGSKTDSASVEMCKQFARRGYVAASMDYRLGWNPLATEQDLRTGQLLQAVYRAIQDAKSCVRYFKSNYATQGNTYKIDTSRIVLVGQGSGGYVALAYVTLDKTSEINLPKFISTIDNPPLFTIGQSYINQSLMGDFEGFGGNALFNTENTPGYSSKVKMAVNMGGALGDSIWLEDGDEPLVAFHVTNDPFAPYTEGMVTVPTTGDPVVYVAGSRNALRRSDMFGNQDVFNIPYNDPYTTRANQVNEGIEGLFPFVMPNPGPPLQGQAGPWEWVDSTDLQFLATVMPGAPSAAAVAAAYTGAFYSNPNIDDKAHALAYIDTVQGYLAPRMVQALQLPGFFNGIGSLTVNSDVTLYPNPASEFTFVRMSNNALVARAEMFDVTGKVVNATVDIANGVCKIETSQLSNGVYFVKLTTDNGAAVVRLVKN